MSVRGSVYGRVVGIRIKENGRYGLIYPLMNLELNITTMSFQCTNCHKLQANTNTKYSDRQTACQECSYHWAY